MICSLIMTTKKRLILTQQSPSLLMHLSLLIINLPVKILDKALAMDLLIHLIQGDAEKLLSSELFQLESTL